MGMARAKADLKDAPPAGQVRSIAYCGDTYTVETADGKVEKVWEFNCASRAIRASSAGSGQTGHSRCRMQGDRASIVFASPKEISETIRHSCRSAFLKETGARAIPIFIAATLINYFWEIGQAPLYQEMGTFAWFSGIASGPAWRCGPRTSYFAFGAVTLRRPDWYRAPGLRGYASMCWPAW